jgi:hypothetical protein
MRYTEKINRLKEFLPFFEKYLPKTTADSILYISLRRNTTWKNAILLVGINDIQYENTIATYASRIIIDIQNYIEQNGMHEHEQGCCIKRVNCFEFNLEKKAQKEAARNNWKKDPWNYFEYVGKDKKNYICSEYMIWKGYKISLLGSQHQGKRRGYVNIDKNIILGSMFLGFYDFKVTDRYGKDYSYLKLGNHLYFKYRTGDAPQLLMTNSIGVVEFNDFGFNNCRYTEVTKATYNKWSQIAAQNKDDNIS